MSFNEKVDLGMRGHFHLELLDRDDNVLDSFDEKNMIVYNARKSMAEIFANLEGIIFAHKVVIGTEGCIDGLPYQPKTEEYGMEQMRDRIFSEVSDSVYVVGSTLEQLLKYDIIQVYIDDETRYFRYNGDSVENYIITESALLDGSTFTEYDSIPYYYTINFELPRTNSYNEVIFPRSEFTAQAGQSQFTCDFRLSTPSVFVNGLLQDSSKYSFTEGSYTITLTTACSEGDIVIITNGNLIGAETASLVQSVTDSTDTVSVVQTDTSVTFTFTMAMDNGNLQYATDETYAVPTTLFNEAGLYVNNRLFSMKTFSSKAKDESCKLKIIWTITF